MDAPGIRPALRDMASRLATAGYYVMLPYLYYRGGPSGVHAERRGHARSTGSDEHDHPTNIVGDAEVMLAHADGDEAARGGPSGRRLLHERRSGRVGRSGLPGRVAAAASIHGAWLVRDTDDSPHRNLDTVRAEVYLAWCDNDATALPETIPVMREALGDGRRPLHARLHRLRRPRLRPAGHRALQPPGIRAALGARPLPPSPQGLTGLALVRVESNRHRRSGPCWLLIQRGDRTSDTDCGLRCYAFRGAGCTEAVHPARTTPPRDVSRRLGVDAQS